MKINTEKTEVMTIARKGKNTSIFIDGQKLKQVEQFTYLGSIISSKGKCTKEIQHRCNITYQILGQMSPILRNKNVNMNTKTALYKTIIIPSLCYQCQTWTLTASDKRKIITTEMACLRRMLGVSIRDKIRNETIRKMTNTTPVMNYIKRQQIKWFAHASRLPSDSIPQKALLLKHSGRRAKGRPCKRWIAEIKEATETSLHEAHKKAVSRELFYPLTLQGTKGNSV
jgi:hypothetical protein